MIPRRRTRWNTQRLNRLFKRYNRRYWGGKLPDLRVVNRKLVACVGEYVRKEQEILVDVSAHPNDREVRSTLLHEMAHAGNRSGSWIAHGYGFWAQIENLLRQRAPIRVGFPEMPQHKFPLSAIPRRFARCRKEAEKLERKRSRDVEREINGKAMPIQDLTNREIAIEFEDAAWEGATWTTALWTLGTSYGLIDLEGKPASAWARRVIKRCRTAHRRGRRIMLASKRASARFASARRQPTTRPETSDSRTWSGKLRGQS
jgi:hypothetical protein